MSASQLDRKAFSTLVLAMLTMALGVGLIIPLLPVYAKEMGASGIWIGLIFGANPFVRGVFTLFIGSLADRMDKKKLILIGLSGYFLIAFGFALARAPWQLFLMRVCQGAFSAAVLPVSRAYAGSLAPPGSEGRLMGMFNLAFFAGFAFGPLTGGVMADQLGRNSPFMGMAVLTGIALVMAYRYLPSQLPVAASGGGPTKRRGVDFRPLSDPHIVGLIAGRAMLAVGRGVFSTLMPVFGESTLALNSAQIGLVVTMRSTLESTLQAPMGRVADTHDRRLIGIVAFSLVPVALFLIPTARTHTALVLFAMLLGMGSGAGVPAVTAMTVEKGRTWGMGSLMGLEGVSMSFGMAAGSSLGGVVMEATSLPTSFRVAGIVGMLGIAVFWVLTRGYQVGPKPQPRQVVAAAPPSSLSGTRTQHNG